MLRTVVQPHTAMRCIRSLTARTLVVAPLHSTRRHASSVASPPPSSSPVDAAGATSVPTPSSSSPSSAASGSTPSAHPKKDHSHKQSKKHKSATAAAKDNSSASAATADAASEEATPTPLGAHESYMSLRAAELKEAGLCDPVTGEFSYPNHYQPTMTIASFIRDFSSLAAGTKLSETEVCLTGRLHSKRDASAKLIFYDLVGSEAQPAAIMEAAAKEETVVAATAATAGTEASTATAAAAAAMTSFSPYSPKVQIMATLAAHETSDNASATTTTTPSATTPASATTTPSLTPFRSLHRALRRGDLVFVRGYPQKTKTGELSIVPKEVKLLAPCWHEIPIKLLEPNHRYRNRYLDMLVNRSILHPFHLRSTVLSALRSFLLSRSFVEVETPILWTNHGGASAKPFITHSHALGGDKIDLFLRIAPELFLKECVIGGMERVFEVSKVFRNEGMDATHNPEFTTVELYQAYSTYEQLMDFTQQLLLDIVRKTMRGKSTVEIKNRFTEERTTIDFAALPYRQIDIMQGLKEAIYGSASAASAGADLPDPNSDESISFYLGVCAGAGLHVGLPHTLPRVLDKLIGHFLEPLCIAPTFLTHHPQCMSPLAKKHPTRKGLTERFELFINGQEYANAYSELNDPKDQYQRMQAQTQQQKQGDEEAQPLDQHYCTALEYGLPPTAGWGLGVDRLVMLLAGTPHIRDVLLFPVMKPQLPPVPGAPLAPSTTSSQP